MKTRQVYAVSSGDCIAAAAWAKSNSRHAQAANILRGSCDTSPIVQAFAKRSHDVREEAAQIAESYVDHYLGGAPDSLAAAIRSGGAE